MVIKLCCILMPQAGKSVFNFAFAKKGTPLLVSNLMLYIIYDPPYISRIVLYIYRE